MTEPNLDRTEPHPGRSLVFFLLSICLFASPAWAASQPSSPLSPGDELASFHLADDRLSVELVAAEPSVISPVAIAWDADGRMFVAEMIDYPLGPGTGQIRMLEDLDGDGRYEKATIFADQLSFPNGVLPWNNGILVTTAPNILFLKDTDGDGRADERRVVLTGFREGNQQLRVNGLSWGLDNWVYAANGRSDGEIRRPNDPTEKALSLRNHDLRFRPDTGEFEVIAGRSQFGRARDDWGNHFLSWNTIPVRHVVIEERYLNRNPQLGAGDGVLDILAPGDTGRVFPLTPPPLVFNKESSSHFNALAGLTIYRGDALGEKYRGNAFMGESLRNLVHRRVLEPIGVTFVARRGEEGQEFLASTDPWFHSVNFATGPDGALYVVDFYRQFVEHPEYVHNASVEKRIPWRTGAEHGRIWRIKSKAAPTASGVAKAAKRDKLEVRPTLSRAPAAELVQYLSHSNAWWRDTAQRLLVERQDREAIPLLKSEIGNPKSETGLTRVHALWTLEGLGALDEKTVRAALQDKHPRVREQAVRLSEEFLKKSTAAVRPGLGAVADRSSEIRSLGKKLSSLVNDRDPRVRLQLGLTAGESDRLDMHDTLIELARRGIGDRWQSLAILSSLRMNPWRFLHLLSERGPILVEKKDWLTLPTDEAGFFLEKSGVMIGADAKTVDFDAVVNSSASPLPKQTLPGRMVFLEGLAAGLAQHGQSLHEWLVRRAIIPKPPTSWPSSILNAALSFSASETVRPRVRVAAIRLLAETEPSFASPTLLGLLEPRHPAQIQSAAAQALVKLSGTELAANPFVRWNNYSQTTRRQLANATSRSPSLTSALLDALEENKIPLVEIDASARQSLQKVSDAKAKARAQKLFQDSVASDREEVVRKFQAVLRMTGEMRRGATVFAKACFVCHRIQGRGNQVGPDLSGIASRPPETVLVDILDPSRQVTPDYLSYTVATARGESLTGLLVAESAASITLRRQSLPDEKILRSQILELRADGKSLMPDGLEQGLTTQDLADLLAFLSQPDGSLLPSE